jgi:uncharacterized protein YhbP (UPF0306 family)
MALLNSVDYENQNKTMKLSDNTLALLQKLCWYQQFHSCEAG